MVIEILAAILIGIILGAITGLIPGIHINLISISLITLSPFLLQYLSPIILAIIIIAMAITHTFLDFLPSTFLGAPDSDTALSILPAHKLLTQGQGYKAVKLATIGSLFGLIGIIILIPLFILIINQLYPIIKNYIAFILIIASSFLILRSNNKLWSLTLFLLSGILGIIVLNLPILKQPLFPLLSGLFGISGLLISLKDKVKIPKQNSSDTKIETKEIPKAISSGIIASSICGILPGIGAAQAAIIASSFYKKITTEAYIILVGSINTIVMIISFIALYTINKARNGAIVAVSKFIESLTLNHFILFIASTLTVAGLATILSLKLGKIFSSIITKINYRLTCISIISLIMLLTIFLSGFIGLFVLFISSLIGLIVPLKNLSRNHLMGCLILPVILFFTL